MNGPILACAPTKMASGGRSDGVSGGERSSRAGQGDDDGTDAGSGPSTTAASSRRSSLSADGEEGTSESGTGPSAPSQNSFTRDGDGEDAEEGGDASSAAGEDAGSGSDAAGAASSAAERLTPVFVDGSADGGSEGGGGTDRSGAGGIAGGGAIDPASLAALTGGGTAATDPSRAAEGARGAAAAIMRTLERAPNARAACSTDTTSDEYLDHYDIPFYVRDAVEVLLATRPAAPLEALHTYFRSVLVRRSGAPRRRNPHPPRSSAHFVTILTTQRVSSALAHRLAATSPTASSGTSTPRWGTGWRG